MRRGRPGIVLYCKESPLCCAELDGAAMVQVTCKVLTVQSGADMPTKARELAKHFETHGTPVMIGGWRSGPGSVVLDCTACTAFA